MKHALRKSVLATLASAGLLAPALAQQSSASPQAPASPAGPARLKDFQATYRQELKKIHEPLLASYLDSLQQLARSLDAAAMPAIEAEISRVRKLIAGGAVLDLAVVSAALDAPEKAGFMPKNMPAGAEIADALILSASQAAGFVPSGVLPETLALGRGSWAVAALPAGSYDLLVQYACVSVPDGARLRASLGTQVIETTLGPERGTRSILDFRVLRVGRLQATAPLTNESLNLQFLPESAGGFRVQRVILSPKAKPAVKRP
jgi:hypothetical protein